MCTVAEDKESVLGWWEQEVDFNVQVSELIYSNNAAHAVDQAGRTKLHVAVACACEESVAALLSVGADPSMPVSRDGSSTGTTALSLAVHTNYPVVVRMLLHHDRLKPHTCGHSLQQLLDVSQQGLDNFLAAMEILDDDTAGVLQTYKHWCFLVQTELRRWFQTGGTESQVRPVLVHLASFMPRDGAREVRCGSWHPVEIQHLMHGKAEAPTTRHSCHSNSGNVGADADTALMLLLPLLLMQMR